MTLISDLLQWSSDNDIATSIEPTLFKYNILKKEGLQHQFIQEHYKIVINNCTILASYPALIRLIGLVGPTSIHLAKNRGWKKHILLW